MGILVGGVPPSSPNPNSISDQKLVIFHTSFQTQRKQNYVIITQIRIPTKRFLKIHFEFPYFSFFLTHLELKQQIRSCTHVFPRIPYPNSDLNRQSLYLSSDQNGAKTVSFRVAITYKAVIREYLPPPLLWSTPIVLQPWVYIAVLCYIPISSLDSKSKMRGWEIWPTAVPTRLSYGR